MNPEQFAYWLHGFAELHPEPPTAAQWKSIREHLDLLFTKVTPEVGKNKDPLEDYRKIVTQRQPPIVDEPWYPLLRPKPHAPYLGAGELIC